MKKPFLALLALVFTAVIAPKASAQYYLQDIFNTHKTVANMGALKTNNVSVQIVQSLDASLNSDEDFVCTRRITPNFRTMRSETQSRTTGYSVLISSFSNKGQLNKILDSTETSISTTQYRYVNEMLTGIETVSRSRDDKFKMTETRNYVYDSTGKLSYMIRRKNGSADSSIVQFKIDSAGHVSEELETGKTIRSQRIYYNYDAQGRLTDVLRYHPTRKRMLPDYIFEYDTQAKLIQMTTVNATTADYTIWKYTYDEKGLPLREMCYGKGNELLGTIRYKYEFNK